MPVLYQGYPISYNPSALERAFDVSGTTDILGVPAWIVLRKDKTAAAIVYAEPSLDERGELRHLVAAKLDLIPCKSAEQESPFWPLNATGNLRLFHKMYEKPLSRFFCFKHKH